MLVLNVLPDPWQRTQALKDAASFARPGGHVVLVTHVGAVKNDARRPRTPLRPGGREGCK